MATGRTGLYRGGQGLFEAYVSGMQPRSIRHMGYRRPSAARDAIEEMAPSRIKLDRARNVPMPAQLILCPTECARATAQSRQLAGLFLVRRLRTPGGGRFPTGVRLRRSKLTKL